MYINAFGSFVPEKRIDNSYFENVNGLDDAWIRQRTGIQTRSRVGEGEDGVTMGLAAVGRALGQLPYRVEEVDLILSASYSPLDTVATMAHIAQRHFQIPDAKVMMLSSACSSFINAMETVEAYFESGKAEKALVICSEHNSYYSNDSCKVTGHLWGDAAVAVFLSKTRFRPQEAEITQVYTRGLGTVGKGPEGVLLRPKEGGIAMPDGRDVFVNATRYASEALRRVCERQRISISDLGLIFSHQANKRIVQSIAHFLELPLERFPCTIERLGNTGSASAMLTAIEYWSALRPGDWAALTVFGGGYSAGAMLLKIPDQDQNTVGRE